MGVPNHGRVPGAPGKQKVLPDQEKEEHAYILTIYILIIYIIYYSRYRTVTVCIQDCNIITNKFTIMWQACDKPKRSTQACGCIHSSVTTINKPVSFKNYRTAAIL